MPHKTDIKPLLEEEYGQVRIELIHKAKMKGVDLSKIKIVNHDEIDRERAKVKARAKAMFVN